MTNAVRQEHFNLYYIFKEDKEQNKIPEQTAADIWANILLATKGRNDQSGLSPPPKT